jgi:hypothetical protein
LTGIILAGAGLYIGLHREEQRIILRG